MDAFLLVAGGPQLFVYRCELGNQRGASGILKGLRFTLLRIWVLTAARLHFGKPVRNPTIFLRDESTIAHIQQSVCFPSLHLLSTTYCTVAVTLPVNPTYNSREP
jgi:hypothetical protein